jgi:hypothetical protein
MMKQAVVPANKYSIPLSDKALALCDDDTNRKMHQLRGGEKL